MTTTEFDTEFDTLYNNITSNQAPGLNGYEKSVFLTKAQNQILAERFNKNIDAVGRGFDGNEQRQIDFSNLIRTESLTDIGSPTDYVRIDPRSLLFTTESDVIGILNDFIDVTTIGSSTPIILTVVPLSYTEYARVMMKPYKYPPKGVAWRLINGSDAASITRCFEIIANNLSGNSVVYRIRYVRRPAPIILENLSSLGVSIEGETNVTNCELPEELHHEVLERAVVLAKMSWQGSTMTQAALNIQANKNKN